LLGNGRPSRVYADKTFLHRYVFEGYIPPHVGRPYRVIFEVSSKEEVVPVSCWRIKDKEFHRKRS
jgi:hypothetical protein